MNELVTRVSTWYAGLDDRRRRRLWLTLVVAVVAAVAAGAFANYAPYKPLLVGRDYDEVLAAAAALETAGIPYRVRDDGRLDVPVSRLGSARAAVAAAEIVPGLQDAGELKLGLTPRAQEWALLRAREGDLARMINGIEGVGATQVHIVPREEALFASEERAATASVFVRLRPGASLTQGQVQAIASLVASAVDGLDADHVTIADDRGNLLRAGAGETGDGHEPGDLFEYRRQLELRAERSVGQALLPVLGSARDFSVTAAVDLDLSSTETVSKRLDVQQQAVLSEQVQESNSTKTEPAGVPGVDANLPERAAPSTPAAAQSAAKSALVTNYVYPTVDEVKRRPAGGVDHLSVAVQVNDTRLGALLGPEATEEAKGELQARIQRAVEAAVGLDAERGDVVTVTFLPFAEGEDWVADPPAAVAIAPEAVLPWVFAIAVAVMSFVFVVRPVMAVALKPPPAQRAEPESPRESDHDIADRLVHLVEDFKPVDASMLNTLVNHQSKAAAQVVRQWGARR